MYYLLAAISGYLFGSIPFAFLIVKIFTGKDLRTIGSKNCGATNVYRAAGFKYALLTGTLDALKAVAVYLIVLNKYGLRYALIAGFFAVVGHCFSIWLSFKGGKGAATGMGLLVSICPPSIIIALPIFSLIVWRTRYVSVASITCALCAAPITWLFTNDTDKTITAAIIGLFIVFMHRTNIKRLMNKTENKIY